MNEKTTRGGIVTAVEIDSTAAAAGVKVGDRLVAINGIAPRDVLDIMFYADEDEVELGIERDGKRLSLSAPFEDYLGLEFGEPTFDGIRRCRNRCEFCFVEQLPQGLRKSLYIKDDDFRYSVLSGSFVTLTNLTEDDWDRLDEQRLGPMRVSVHATDLATRRRLLGNPTAPDVLEQFKRLANLHIGVHCQIVLVPDQNDGGLLIKTVTDLAQLAPSVESIAIVPVGRTRYSSVVGARDFTTAECLNLVKQVEAWQRLFRREHGVGLVYLGDDFYMRAGRPVPSTRSYDGFPQYENGVGMVRCLLDDWTRQRKHLLFKEGTAARHLTVACGSAIAPTLSGIMAELTALGGPAVEVVAIENHFFGKSVTTSGLLTAEDVLEGLIGRAIGDMVVLPRTMLDSEGKTTIDGQSPEEIERRLGVPVAFAGLVSEMLLLTECAEA